jgi:DNA-binding NarL/FixJ family response regulator
MSSVSNTMGNEPSAGARRVFIVSANTLFCEGLRKLYAVRWGKKASIIGVLSTTTDAIQALESSEPDLVIVDYDDKTINRAEFLNKFVVGKTPMQVVLVTLRNRVRLLCTTGELLPPLKLNRG